MKCDTSRLFFHILLPVVAFQASNMANNSELISKLKHILAKRDEEQVQLQELNGRFASYIEKIRSLEQKNQKLKVEVMQLQSHESKRVTELYEEKINNLRMEVQNQNQYSSRLELQLEDLKERCVFTNRGVSDY